MVGACHSLTYVGQKTKRLEHKHVLMTTERRKPEEKCTFTNTQISLGKGWRIVEGFFFVLIVLFQFLVRPFLFCASSNLINVDLIEFISSWGKLNEKMIFLIAGNQSTYGNVSFEFEWTQSGWHWGVRTWRAWTSKEHSVSIHFGEWQQISERGNAFRMCSRKVNEKSVRGRYPADFFWEDIWTYTLRWGGPGDWCCVHDWYVWHRACSGICNSSHFR